jgi:hypothetical protein
VLRFFVRSSLAILSTSYKVMYFSLLDCGMLGAVDETEFLTRVRQIKGARSPQHLLPVRNPYDRLRSFFFDKLRKNLPATAADWQYCQLIYLPLKGAGLDTPFDNARTALRDMGFAEFVEYLPKVMWNGHLRRQADLLSCNVEYLRTVTQIFPMKHAAEDLWRRLEVREPPRGNRTLPCLEQVSFTRWHLDLVNDLYEPDFREFGYDMC